MPGSQKSERVQIRRTEPKATNPMTAHIGASIWGVPHFMYSIMGPQNPILIISAPYIKQQKAE